MIKQIFKKVLPYLLVFVGFILLSYAYFPSVLTGKKLGQIDISSWLSASNETRQHNYEHPADKALWTGSMFSGMPTNTIQTSTTGNLLIPLKNALNIGKYPTHFLVISLIGSFLLMLAFGAGFWLSLLGSFAITFCSYNMQIIQVGHNTKMMAIAFMPWVLASLVLAYRKNYLLGSVFFGVTLSFELISGHPQISYYLAYIVAGFAIAELCGAIKSHTLPSFIKTSCTLLICGFLGIATHAEHLVPLQEFAKYTIRGGSELPTDDSADGDGLSLNYATQFSYGITETPNLMIPNFMGGATHGKFSPTSETSNFIKKNYSNSDNILKRLPQYWGPQPFTSGPMYLGAVSIFLFVLGLFIVKGRYKWWIASISLLTLMLAWGNHLMWFTELWFKYVPMYNKFRTVTMIMVILQITVPVMGVLALMEVFSHNQDTEQLKKRLLWAFYITGGFCLLFSVFPGLAGHFSSRADSSVPDEIVSVLIQDRKTMLRTDAFRSFLFITIGALMIWLSAIKGKMKERTAIICIAVLVLCDLWIVDKRYLNHSHFSTQKEYRAQFNKRPADEMILKDTDLSYRVLDLSVADPFKSALASNWHKSVGGYNAAKIQRYEELIKYCFRPEISELKNELQYSPQMSYYPMLSMLNTRYIIVDGKQPPIVNNRALGNAWFVHLVMEAETPEEEIEKLGRINPATGAVIYTGDGTDISTLIPRGTYYGITNDIHLSEYSPNRLEYDYTSELGGLAIFSEIYYPIGWKAYLDGETELPILRANWTLRALKLPAGTHHITFKYHPDSLFISRNISMASSIILYLLLLAVVSRSIFVFYRNKNK